MAHRKKILVLESETLLGASILSLLASREELEVCNSTVTSLDSPGWPNDSKPDVIIMEESELLANISDVLKLVDRYPNLRLIVFGPRENKLYVVDKQMIEVRQVNDFLELL